MRALITGGAGFIGSTLVDRLLGEGTEVLAVDNLSTGRMSNLDPAARDGGGRFAFEEADIRDPTVTGLVERFSPDLIIHLAAQADVRVSVVDPAMDAMVNIVGTINVLEAARSAGVRKVLFASSGGTIYGEGTADLLPLGEDVVRQPLSPYGIAKEAATGYLRAYSKMHGIVGTALALGNVYGPRQDAHGEAGVVAIFAGRLLVGEPCTIYGSGEQTRDFVYVDDVVDAFVRAAQSDVDGLLNVGTGCEVTINRLYQTMAEARGVVVDAQRAPARKGELERNCLDSTRARTLLGWTPKVSLSEGVKAVFASLEAARGPGPDPRAAG